MKKTLLLLAFTATLTSCAPQITYHSGVFSEPTINEVTTSELGDAIYTTEDLVYRHGVKIVKLPTERIFQGNYPYSIGDVIPQSRETNNQKVFSHNNAITQANGIYYKSPNATKFGMFGVLIRKNSGEIYPSYGFSSSPQIEKVDGLVVEDTKYVDGNCDKCIKKEFIYNGKINNSLKFIYREYIRDMARPAFTQELQYDLNESTIIGFKGLRIEILKSTNTIIEYKVLNELN